MRQLYGLAWVVGLHAVGDFDDAILDTHTATIDGHAIAFHILHAEAFVDGDQTAKVKDALQEGFLRGGFDGEIRVQLLLHCGLRRSVVAQSIVEGLDAFEGESASGFCRFCFAADEHLEQGIDVSHTENCA